MNTSNLLEIPTSELAKLEGYCNIEHLLSGAGYMVSSKIMRCPKKRAIAHEKELETVRQNKEKYVKDLLTSNGLL